MSLEYCFRCGDPTGRAGRGDDSIYMGDEGPFCEKCYGVTLARGEIAKEAKVLGKQGGTERGFPIIRFDDYYEKECSLECSSIWLDGNPCGASAVWLGVVDERMHLTREQVAGLCLHLISWLQKGEFE